MYDTLRPEKLTATSVQILRMKADPTEVVNLEMFRENQYPYLEVRRPFILGTAKQEWKPTLAHFFIKVLAEKKKLVRVYTQNIDALDYQIGLEEDMIVPLHGSIGKASCEICEEEYPFANANALCIGYANLT